ncbi:MAG: sigma-70 family RNA polymerase sigma factor [Candidatus Omnitrophota bacterium]
MEFLNLFCVLFIVRLINEPEPPLYDDELVEKAKEGDRAAFDILYNKYKRPILNYIYRLIGDIHQAEELTQETFIRVYTNIGRYVKKTKFSSWVYTIAGNLAKNYLRDTSYVQKVSIDKSIDEEEGASLHDLLEDHTKRPDNAALKNEAEKLIQQGLEKLKQKHRKVIVLCDIQGLSYEDAAKALGCPPATVGSRLSRAREKLAKVLGFTKPEVK